MIFTIEPDNNISVFPSARQAKAAMMGEYEQFVNEKELAALAANWPGTRLTDIWNSLPGVTPVKKFKDRTTGANRIWQALQSRQPEAITPEATTPDVTPDSAPQAAAVASKKARSGKQATEGKEPRTTREGSKTATILTLIQQPGGATLAEIMEASGWQAHSVRGFISGTLGKKMGLKIDSSKREDGTRVYTLAK